MRGENDFVYRDGCRISNVVPADGGRGEDVTRVSELVQEIPKKAEKTGLEARPAPEIPELPEPGGAEFILKAFEAR